MYLALDSLWILQRRLFLQRIEALTLDECIVEQLKMVLYDMKEEKEANKKLR